MNTHNETRLTHQILCPKHGLKYPLAVLPNYVSPRSDAGPLQFPVNPRAAIKQTSTKYGQGVGVKEQEKVILIFTYLSRSDTLSRSGTLFGHVLFATIGPVINMTS